MVMRQVVAERGKGRPRQFDEDSVLDSAIALFRAAGFSASGINDLTRTTGLSVGSLYKAYGDKEGLFAKALERYIAQREAEVSEMLKNAGNARDRIGALLRLYSRLSRGDEGMLGCLLVVGIAELGHFSHVGDVLREQMCRRRLLLAQLVAQGHQDGSIASSSDPDAVAELLLALLYGLRVLGKTGNCTVDPEAFVTTALKSLD
jgi:AcrR family transcriptional regulator